MVLDIERCTGCSACESICPKKCITMIENEEGFLYPYIDKDVCVECGLCKDACPLDYINERQENTKIYAFQNKNIEDRNRSSSGGAFVAIATWVLERNGVVFGAGYTEDNTVVQCCVETITELHDRKLCRSKYVQSKVGNTYKEVESYLKTGRMVCYAGTPCQIAGLYTYLGREYENLLLIDLICKGVPSPKLYKKLLKHIQDSYKSKIIDVNFRDKSYGYKNPNFVVTLKNGKVVEQTYELKSYLIAFFNNITSRKSCYQCSFKGVERVSDITLGDFWSVEKKKLFDKKGTTAILSHSKKAEECLMQIKGNVILQEADIEDIEITYLLYSQKKSNVREEFFSQIDNEEYIGLIKNYVKISWKSMSLYRIRKILKKLGYYKLKF